MQNIEDSYRLYYCQFCNKQVRICPRCDRCNRYCSKWCSHLARLGQMQAASRRYQNTKRGRKLHALRQNEYRKRRKAEKKVTHQGSPPVSSQASIDSVTFEKSQKSSSSELHPVVFCSFCGNACEPLARYEPSRLRRRVRRKMVYRFGLRKGQSIQKGRCSEVRRS